MHLEASASLVLAKFSLNFKSINLLPDAGLYHFKHTLSDSFTKTTTESSRIFSQTTEVLMFHPVVLTVLAVQRVITVRQSKAKTLFSLDVKQQTRDTKRISCFSDYEKKALIWRGRNSYIFCFFHQGNY